MSHQILTEKIKLPLAKLINVLWNFTSNFIRYFYLPDPKKSVSLYRRIKKAKAMAALTIPEKIDKALREGRLDNIEEAREVIRLHDKRIQLTFEEGIGAFGEDYLNQRLEDINRKIEEKIGER